MTPNQIKKALECCGECGCKDKGCPYEDFHDCEARMHTEALAYIQQLETERDTLISDIKEWGASCAMCKHYANEPDEIPCRFCVEMHPEDEDRISHWEWRGLPKEG